MSPPSRKTGRFNDFDQFSEATREWGFNWRQLGQGPLTAELSQVGVASALVTHIALNRGHEQQGSTPSGARTFGLIEEGVTGVRWCDRAVSDRELLAFGRGGEYHAVSGPSFACQTVALSEERVAEVAATLDDPGVDSVLADGSARAATCDPEAVEELRNALRRVGEACASGPSIDVGCGLRNELESEIPARLLRTLASARGEVSPPSFGARELAIRRALPFIEAHQDGLITLADLCRATRLSRRTLHYAFKEHFGVTPKAYVTALRLDGVRRELVPRDTPLRVADVADRWGFWHMGQFAADYRKQFGELPSETLKRRGAAAS